MMRVVLFGASGMVGQGVLRECLLADDVHDVLAVVRSPLHAADTKLRQLRVADFQDFEPLADALTGYDACFFSLGVSSAGMNEADYTRITYDTTLAAARLLVRVNPTMVFLYVSGEGTDSSEKGRSMWARVKGRTENALLALPLRAAYMLRPGFIKPLHGITSKTRLYRAIYSVASSLFPLLRAIVPGHVTTTEEVGRAMLEIARGATAEHVLGNREIAALARTATLHP